MQELLSNETNNFTINNKYVPVINQRKLDINNSRGLFSFEICNNQNLDVKKLNELNPNFCSIPWHLKSYEDVKYLQIPSIHFANYLALNGHQVVVNLAGKNLTKREILKILDAVKAMGLRNIFALQGDKNRLLKKRKHVTEDFPHAIDLVAFIRRRYGDYFTVGVAAYPDTHPESLSEEQDVEFLKNKVRAGADYILTQATFDVKTLMRFLQNCTEAKIDVPIVFGFYLFDSYDDLMKITSFCNIKLSNDVWKVVFDCKNNSEAVRNFSIYHHGEMMKKINEQTNKYLINLRIHLFTLNNLKLTSEFVKRFEVSYIEKPIVCKQ